MLNVKVDRKEILKAIQIVENSVTENKIREVLSGLYRGQRKLYNIEGNRS